MPKLTTIPDVTVPCVHLNGTSKQDLIDQLSDAIDAIHEAGRKLAAAAPNRRDYYLTDGHWEAAVKQHDRRVATLKELADSLEWQMNGVYDQA